MHPLRKRYSVDDSIDSWALFDRTFPSTTQSSPAMSRRVFDVGLDVDRIKNGLKLHSTHRRNRTQRSASISGSPPKELPNGNQLAIVPKLKGKRSNPTLGSEEQEDVQPLSPEPVVLPSLSSPTTHDFPQPPMHSPSMNGTREDHMEPLHTPTDDSNDFDLKAPPPNKPVRFLEHYSEKLFSDGHLRFILRDQAFFLRFTAFLNRYKSHAAPILLRYLEAQKALKAVEYANAVAESLKPVPGDASSQIPCAAATLDPRFESRSRRAMDTLVNEALPAYITQAFTKVVTESMVREITGTTMPIMRELVGGLAEVFCLSDPSIKDNPIVYASEEFYRTTQYGRDYVIGRNCRFLQGPKTDRNTVARIKEAVRTGQESFETILNYRRDGSPFMNLVMTAPLYDNKGVVRYYIGAQVDISGLVEEGRGLDSFERYLAESRRNRNSDQSSYSNQKHMRVLSEFSQMLSADESSVFHGQGHSREGSVNESEHGSSRSTRAMQQQGRRDPNARQRRRVLGSEDEDEQEKERNAWAFTSLGPSGKLPGVYQNYLLLRPHPSLRIIFVSPSLRIPGLLQTPFLSRIGGPSHVRSGLANAFEHGEGITAKITWLPQGEDALANRPGSNQGGRQNNAINPNQAHSEGRTRYISCTPLLGSDDKVGVWMVVMVENEAVTGSLPSRINALARYGTSYSNPHHTQEIPPTPSEYEREPTLPSNKTSDERVRSPAPSWRGANGTTPTPSATKGAKRFHGSLNRGVGERGDAGRMYADFMRYQRSGGGKAEPNTVNGNNVVTPPAGTGKVLGSEPDIEFPEEGREGGILDGVGDGGK